MSDVAKYEELSMLARRIGRLGTATLRKVFAKYAENSAFEALDQICTMSNVDISESSLRLILRETVVPAYSNGWLENVVTLKQLKAWVDRRAILVLADPLVDVIGLHQYFLLHCLTSAVDAKKMHSGEALSRCPAAAYIHPDVFSNAMLDEWRSGASMIRITIAELEPRDGLERWLQWVAAGDSKKLLDTIPLPDLV